MTLEEDLAKARRDLDRSREINTTLLDHLDKADATLAELSDRNLLLAKTNVELSEKVVQLSEQNLFLAEQAHAYATANVELSERAVELSTRLVDLSRRFEAFRVAMGYEAPKQKTGP